MGSSGLGSGLVTKRMLVQFPQEVIHHELGKYDLILVIPEFFKFAADPAGGTTRHSHALM